MNAQPLKNGQMVHSSSERDQDLMQLRSVTNQSVDRRAFAEKLVGAEWAEWY